MTGFPRDKAWAQAQVREHGGRPHRAVVFCLLLDLPEDAWKAWGRKGQLERFAKFLLDGDGIRWSNDDELFIVDAVTGGLGQGDDHDRPISEIQGEKAAAAHWANAKQKLTRAAYAEAYAQATIQFGSKYVALEHEVLERALAPDASAAERRMALAMAKDWKDRHMGKPVAPTEDVTTKPSDVDEFLALDAPDVLPLSAGWTVESVAEEQMRELEAGRLGTIEGE